jgi:hypothetical protein
MADSKKKEYYTIEEVGRIVGQKRATVYSRIKGLGIKTHKFKMDRKAYVAAADVEKIKAVLEKPWLAGKDEEKEDKEAEEKPAA